ncbi:hypothetical protein PMIN03_001394 [Paraphaeosphaeria minitans]
MLDSEKEVPGSKSEQHRAEESVKSADPSIATKEVGITGEDDAISIAHSTTTTSGHDEKQASGRPYPPATLTKTTSVNPEAVVVHRKNRRGLFGSLTIIPEVENSYHYARKTKWFITAIVAACAMGAPMGSAIVMPALQDIAKAFGASSTLANMSVAVYMLSMAIFPLWWSSFSETAGRRTIYLISFTMFTLFAILSAVSTNMAMLIVMRTLSGGAAASVQAVGAGTVADIWEIRERGRAMGMFYLGPLCGPLFAPIIGGVLAQTLGWRSTQWFLAIYGGLTLLLITFAMPETLRRTELQVPTQIQQSTSEKTTARPDLTRVSTRQSVQTTSKTTLKTLRRYFLDPLVVLTWLRYPPVALTVYYASITFGSLYCLNISIQASFSTAPYSFKTIIVGLLYIPGSIGYILASAFGGKWIDKIMHREARKAGRYDASGKLILRPEDRMRENAWIAAVLWPGALLWYGWTVQHGVIWIVPMVANFFFGVGSMLIFALSSTMLTEFMPKRASAGIAINNFVRNICSFTGAVVAEPIIHAIGNGWFMTILGLWSLVTGLMVVWAMGRYAGKWRVKMVAALG